MTDAQLFLPEGSLQENPRATVVVHHHQVILYKWRKSLSQMIDQLQLPVSPIDVIVSKLGGSRAVAEVSERPCRSFIHTANSCDNSVETLMTIVSPTGELIQPSYFADKEYHWIETRGVNAKALWKLNEIEMSNFCSGQKPVLLLSLQAGLVPDLSRIDSKVSKRCYLFGCTRFIHYINMSISCREILMFCLSQQVQTQKQP